MEFQMTENKRKVEMRRERKNVYSTSQTKCIEKMCEKHGVTLKKRANAPITQERKLSDYESSPKANETAHRSMIGAVLYVSVATRPDMSHAASTLAKCSTDPRKMHVEAVLRLMTHLLKTKHLAVSYGHVRGLTAYADVRIMRNLPYYSKEH